MASSSARPTQNSEEDESSGVRATINTTSEFDVVRRHEGWLLPLRLYGKFWIVEVSLRRVLELRRDFLPRATDVFLATYPKSGTTWLKSLIYAVANRSQHPPRAPSSSSADGDHQHPLLTHNPHELVRHLEIPYREIGLANLESLPVPRILATHMPYSLLPPSVAESSCRIIYLCRDPKDNFVSMWRFVNKTRHKPLELNEGFEMYCEGCCHGGPVWEHNLEYWKESQQRPEKVFFLKYEEMMAAPEEYTRKLAEFIGFPFTAEEERENVVKEVVQLCSFEKLSGLEVNKNGILNIGEYKIEKSDFFRKGKVGDWSNYLTLEMGKQLDCIFEEKLRGTGLIFHKA